MLLTLLDRDGSIEVVASVYLQTLLIRSDIELDTSDIGGHCENTQVVRFWGRIARAIEDERFVIACTAETAAIDCLLNVSANLLGRREFQMSIIDDADSAIQYFNVIELDVMSGVWHVERVAQDR